MSIVTKIGSRGVSESKHLPGVVCIGRWQFEEVWGEGGEGEGEGEGVERVRGHCRRPGRVKAPELGCNFVEGWEVWLGWGQGGGREGRMGRPAVQTKGACIIMMMMMGMMTIRNTWRRSLGERILLAAALLPASVALTASVHLVEYHDK